VNWKKLQKKTEHTKWRQIRSDKKKIITAVEISFSLLSLFFLWRSLGSDGAKFF
jgi:hypothetical protein